MTTKIGIVGGGLAGISSAIGILNMTRDVELHLFEEHSRIGGELSGNACSAATFEILRRKNIQPSQSWIARSFETIRVYFPKGNKAKIDYEDANVNGHMIHKDEVERGLARIARKKGCRIRRNYEVFDVRKRWKRFKVRVRHSKRHQISRYKFDGLIDASGYPSRIALLSGMVDQKFYEKVWRRSWNMAVQLRMRGDFKEQVDGKRIDIYLQPNRPSAEFFYAFAIDEDEANVGYVSSTYRRRKKCEDDLNSCIKEHDMDKFEIIDRRGKFIPSRGPKGPSFGDGIIRVGDAQGQVEQIFRSGIRLAIECGFLGGEMYGMGCNASNLSADMLQNYEKAWKSLPAFNHLRQLTSGKQVIEKICGYKRPTQADIEALKASFDIIKRYTW